VFLEGKGLVDDDSVASFLVKLCQLLQYLRLMQGCTHTRSCVSCCCISVFAMDQEAERESGRKREQEEERESKRERERDEEGRRRER